MIKGIMTVDDSSISLRRPNIAPENRQNSRPLLAAARRVLS